MDAFGKQQDAEELIQLLAGKRLRRLSQIWDDFDMILRNMKPELEKSKKKEQIVGGIWR
jgi:hypothetical protein